MSKKFYVETFGCQMNVADSQEMSRHLLKRGFSQAAQAKEADCILLNTCTVREHAEHKALSHLGTYRDWKGENDRRTVIVSGCAAERMKESLQKRFPHVDLVIGAKSIDQFSQQLDRLFGHPFDAEAEDDSLWPDTGSIQELLPQEKIAYITIMRGCNYSCSYCIVPSVRGKELYRPASSILDEVRQKAALGLKEILLLGQTVNSYRPQLPNPDEKGNDVVDFADLLRALDRIKGVERIRFMSPHPFYLNDRLIAAMAEAPSVCPHMHLPVQSGSTSLLRRMRRNYSREEYLDRVGRLKKAIPDMALTTDIIVGFPGETEADFEDTLSLIDAVQFDGAFCFKYSPRPGTESAKWPDDVEQTVKEERLNRLLEKIEAMTLHCGQQLVGTQTAVMIDVIKQEDNNVFYEGRTGSSRRVMFSSDVSHKEGDTVDVMIQETVGRLLKGRALALERPLSFT